MSQLTALLVHPDPEARHTLRTMLDAVPFIRVLGECVSAREALDLLDAVPYGTLFIGVDLSEGMSGLELAQLLLSRKHRPAMVFLAEDEQHAFAAFELDATDYLIFPCTEDRFSRTLDRLRQFRSHFKLAPEPASRWKENPAQRGGKVPSVPENGDNSLSGLPFADADDEYTADTEEILQLALGEDEQEHFLAALKQAWDHSAKFRPMELERLPITQDGNTMLLPYNEIIFVEAYEDYTYVHTATQKYLTSYRMKVLEGRLKKHRFFRVHRKYLVNLDMVTEIASLPGSNFMLRTAGRTRIELPISRRRLGELKQVLGL